MPHDVPLLEVILTFAVRIWLVLVICDPLSLLFTCLLLAERVSDILLCDDWDAQGLRSFLDHRRFSVFRTRRALLLAMLRYRSSALR